MNLSPISIAILGDSTSFKSALNVATSSTAGFVSSVVSAVGTMAAAAAATVAAVGATSVTAFAQFEQTLSRIEGLTGVAKAQVKAFGDEIRKLGPLVGKSSNELAEGLYFITSSGFKGTQALEILAMAAKASAAGLGEVKVVADTVTSAMNAYTASNLTAAQATDILTAAVREGKGEADAFAKVMGRTMPIAAAMGVSFADVAGVMAVMTRTGASAAEAGVHVKSFLSSLQGPGREARATMAGVGITYGQMRELIAKPGGLVEAMRLLNRVFEGNPEALHSVEPNIRAMMGMLNVLSQDGTTVDDVMRGVRNSAGDTQRAFEVASKTIAFKFGQLKSVIGNTFISIGQSMVPAIETIERFWEKIEPLRTALMNTEMAWLTLLGNTATSIFGSVAVDWESLQNTLVIGLQILEYGFLNFGEMADLVWTSVRLGAATAYNEIEHFFLQTIPDVLGWFGGQWFNAWETWMSFVGAAFFNLSGNIAKVIANLPGLIRGSVSLKEIWTPLLEGAKNTLKELPQLTQRSIGAFEQSLMDKQNAQAEGIATGVMAIRDRREKERLKAVEDAEIDATQRIADEIERQDAMTAKKKEEKLVNPIKKATQEVQKYSAAILGSVGDRVSTAAYLATLPTAMAANQMQGPTVDGQAELKKSNDLLAKIAENTKQTVAKFSDWEEVNLEE